MSDEKKESRIKLNDLPQPEQELTRDETQEVQGGMADGSVRFVNKPAADAKTDVHDGTSNTLSISD